MVRRAQALDVVGGPQNKSRSLSDVHSRDPTHCHAVAGAAKGQIPLRYLVADKFEAGRRRAASWNLAYHLARQQRPSTR